MNAIEPKRHLSDAIGMYHYDMFEKIFDQELARSQRYNGSLTLLHISVQVRDTNPDAREKACFVMADLLNRSLRISNVPAYKLMIFGTCFPA